MITLELPFDRHVIPESGGVIVLGETDALRVQGLAPGAEVRIGPVAIPAGPDGVAIVRPVDHEDLQCQIGLISLELPDGPSLEIDVRPRKVTEEAFRVLRRELEAVWLGLTLDPTAPSAVPARRGPPPTDLWKALQPVVADIVRQPRLTLQPALRHVEISRLRSLSGVSPATAVRMFTGTRSVFARTTSLEVSKEDLAVVVDTLLRLAAKARRWGDRDTEDEVAIQLGRPPLSGVEPSSGATHGARHDARYRAVLRVRSQLTDPAAIITEGPGGLRLGVRAMDRLFEYWVYLRVITSAIERFGPPEPAELSQLMTSTGGGQARLILSPGTTLSFAGGIQVVFEPKITYDPRVSWQGLELAPHPDPRHARSLATPDVLIMEGSQRRALVLDAKYRARHHVELAAVEIHSKYARVRHRGSGVVHKVLAVHPHHGFRADFAGYGHLGWCPGRELPELPWDLLVLTAKGPARPTVPVAGAGDEDFMVRIGPGTSPVLIADQKWMRYAIGSRRVDLAQIKAHLQPDANAFIVMPAIGALAGFAAACKRAGWHVIGGPLDRVGQLARLRAFVEVVGNRELIIVSGNEDFLATATLAPRHRIVGELESLDIWF